MKVYMIISTAMFTGRFVGFGGLNSHGAFLKREDAVKEWKRLTDKQNEFCKAVGSNAGALAYKIVEEDAS